jgi:hypothetical protein
MINQTDNNMINKIFKIKFLLAVSFFSFLLFSPVVKSYGKKLPEGVIPVSAPGSYAKAGAVYMLTNDIVSEKSAIFLGKDVTLDLNGCTITYAGGDYKHVPNSGFENGLKGWDISRAPGAIVVNTAEVHAFIGEKILSLQPGDEIRSPYINLPVEGRSYFAMCGLTGRYYRDMGGDLNNDMKISVYVEDENGNEVECINHYGDTTMIGTPVLNRSTRLGGGFIFAHLKNLPAGKYRVKVKAETDCLVDEIDIRPAMDVGIGIVEKTHPYGHYNHFYDIVHSAFYDYTENFKDGKAVAGIPTVEGKGTVTIKNGTIKSGTRGIASWGIQSTADDVRVILDSVTIINQGINATAVDVPHATITNCIFKVDNPFIINRHGSQFYAVDLRGTQASEVSYSEFYGGQGNLVIKGLESKIHHNYFVNRQTVTNHYSIMAMGDGSMIFENKFEPEIGSGLEIFRHKNIEIFNNEFIIKASPPSCEYADRYSTNAIRVADYGSEWGSPRGAYGNRIYNNKFHITGKKYKAYPDYIPVANAFFFSTSAGDNYIFGNEIIVEQEDPNTDAEAFAFYIGNARGGHLHNNHIVSNVTPIWVACGYGTAIETKIYNNTFIKAPNAPVFKPVRMGSFEQKICVAENVEFRSNEFQGMDFAIDATSQHHSYKVSWTLNINSENPGSEIQIFDKNGKKVISQKLDNNGQLNIELPEYSVDGDEKKFFSPYTILAAKMKKTVHLNQNSKIEL